MATIKTQHQNRNANLAPVLSTEFEISVVQPGTRAWQQGLTVNPETGVAEPIDDATLLKKDDVIYVGTIPAGHYIQQICAVIIVPYDKNTTMKIGNDDDNAAYFASLNASDTKCKVVCKDVKAYIDEPLEIRVEITAMAGQATEGQVILLAQVVQSGVKTYYHI